jgi:GTPase SAR1 family protein
MSDRRKARLDELERHLTGAKRIALFGHRAVGKTTLLAMFYREAAHGRVPGVRLAAADPTSAEYLAEKIAQIEAGEPPAGTLAETALRLRLYHNHARFDLVVKDYQGEHVALGSDAPIREFFADCDAVLLCLDPDGADRPADRRRRQQEVEELLERYIERSDDATTDRPVALLVTKYDRVLDRGGPTPERVEELVEARYGMTRHALARHARHGAMFAVSSYGLGAGGDGRPPAELHPLGLEGPLGWLADRLEAGDRERLEWLWDLAPDDLPRLARCVAALERRYPHSEDAAAFRRRLGAARRRRLRRGVARLAAAAAVVAAGMAGYDAWGYRAAMAFERDHPAPAVERRWADLLAWHPSLPLFWPADARRARHKLDEWKVKAAVARVAAGTAGPGVEAEMRRLKEDAPDLTLEIRRVEEARERQRHDLAWRALQVADLAAIEDPEAHLAAARRFLRDFPETPRRAEAVKLIEALGVRADARRDKADRQAVDALVQASRLPDADLGRLIGQAQGFLDEHPQSRWRPEVQGLLSDYVARLDDLDFEKARQFSRESPTNFNVRIRKYQDYLRAHEADGQHRREAADAIARVERDRDVYLYRQAYDYAAAHPDDVAEVARQLRAYLAASPEGRFARDARAYADWWDKVAVPGEYRVVLRRGEVEPDVGQWMAGGAPDLAVEVEVAGVRYGPSPVAPNSRRPIWDYEFPRPIRWKYGDPIVVRILDYDWSFSGKGHGVFRFTSPKGDKLAIRMLSGIVRPAHGGKTTLVFASDFRMPALPRPE